MKAQFLFPYQFKLIGWILMGVSLFYWISFDLILDYNVFPDVKVFAIIGEVDGGFLSSGYKLFTWQSVNPQYTIIGSLLIIGGLLVAFSAQREEDEYIAFLRLRAFQWSVLINYLILLFLFLFVYGYVFLDVMIYNMFLVIILYILRFHYLNYKNRN